MKYVLFRTGKIEIIGPFNSIARAAKEIVDRDLLGYQILPLKAPEASAAFPESEQTGENFLNWSENFPWSMEPHDILSGKFLANAEKKFPNFFGGGTGIVRQKIRIIKGLRNYFYKNGVDLGLMGAKAMVEDYESVMKGE